MKLKRNRKTAKHYILKTGAELISDERNRQKTKEGWTQEHDDGHRCFELSSAAATYIINTLERERDNGIIGRHVLAAAANYLWAWDPEWHKSSKNPIRNLVKSGALIAAEIDRLIRDNSDDADAAQERKKCR